MPDRTLQFRLLPGRFAISRLPPDAAVPQWAISSAVFTSITRTADEMSIVSLFESVPQEHKPQTAWACLQLQGPFSFSEVGILASFIGPLAENRIPIFACSSYDTDYVLVPEQDATRAIKVLEHAGHQLTSN